jgi:hypothetical protein
VQLVLTRSPKMAPNRKRGLTFASSIALAVNCLTIVFLYHPYTHPKGGGYLPIPYPRTSRLTSALPPRSSADGLGQSRFPSFRTGETERRSDKFRRTDRLRITMYQYPGGDKGDSDSPPCLPGSHT